MSTGKIIAITGGPRTGKSTLVKLLSKKLSAVPFLEGEEKDFPTRVIDDIKNGERILELILYFRNKLAKEYLEALKLKSEGKTVVLDTFWATNDVYIDEWVADQFEKEILRELGRIDRKIFPWPDVVISLSSDKDTIKKFVIAGGREFETSDDFLQKQVDLNIAHNKYFRNLDKPNIYFIDVSKNDFQDEKIIDELMNKIKL
jgi:deoxyadenosine/deoxycytidine kinase